MLITAFYWPPPQRQRTTSKPRGLTRFDSEASNASESAGEIVAADVVRWRFGICSLVSVCSGCSCDDIWRFAWSFCSPKTVVFP